MSIVVTQLTRQQLSIPSTEFSYPIVNLMAPVQVTDVMQIMLC